MAIHADSKWEVRSTATASNVNGGFFKTGASGVDYSQQNSAQYALTGVTSAGSGDTLLTASAAADMVGNGCKAVSGTNVTVGWFEVVSVVVGVSITFSTNRAGASIATGVVSNGVLNIGGALVLLDDTVLEAGSPGNFYYVKGGATYSPAASISIGTNDGTAALPVTIQGYHNARGTLPTLAQAPIINMAGNQISWGAFYHVKNMRFTSSNGNGCLALPGACSVHDTCEYESTAASATAYAVQGSNNALFFNCHLVTQGRGVVTNAIVVISNCYIEAGTNGVTLTSTGNPAFIMGNIIKVGSDSGISITGNMTEICVIANNTIYSDDNTGTTGVLLVAGATCPRMFGNIIHGFENDTNFNGGAVKQVFADYNFYTAANTNVGAAGYAAGPHEQYDVVTTFPDAGTEDYTPDDSVLSESGPSQFFGSTTMNYRDVGAVQKQFGEGVDPADLPPQMTGSFGASGFSP